MTSIRKACVDDLPPIYALLGQSSLPTDDLPEADVAFFVDERDGTMIGVIGLQRFGTSALVRSLAVAAGHRGQGVAGRLVAVLETEARLQGIAELFLLTQTAERFFSGQGYHAVARDRAPDALRASAEFRSLCPASAVCMGKRLSPSGG